jgi:hypothetical protein
MTGSTRGGERSREGKEGEEIGRRKFVKGLRRIGGGG